MQVESNQWLWNPYHLTPGFKFGWSGPKVLYWAFIDAGWPLAWHPPSYHNWARGIKESGK